MAESAKKVKALIKQAQEKKRKKDLAGELACLEEALELQSENVTE